MGVSRRVLLRTMAQSGMAVTMLAAPALLRSPLLNGTARAQQDRGVRALVEKINSNTIMLLTAGSGLTYGALAHDLATVLNDGDDLRILPVQGHSAFQSVRDVRYLRGIDMGFTRTNILGAWRRSGEIPDLADKIVYIFKVCNIEENLIARSDVTSIEQLRGKKVNFNQVGSGTQMSAHDIFSRFKIEVEETNFKEGDALEKLKNGEIAGVVATAGKPSPVLRRLAGDYHIVPIPFDVSTMLSDYIPSRLTHEDYPNLIPEGKTVDTLASGVIVVAYNWPKNSDHYRRLDKFVAAFFPRLAEFQKPPRHAKWKDTNLAATVPGWKRFEAAEEWLKNTREQELGNMKARFQQFLASRSISAGSMRDSERDRLFQEFLKWMTASSAH